MYPWGLATEASRRGSLSRVLDERERGPLTANRLVPHERRGPRHRRTMTVSRSGELPMHAIQPHFLLFSEATADARPSTGQADQWRFVLESVDDGQRFSVTERESETSGERLELLAVVRGLEALDQPSRVTLVTKSRYVSRGFRRGLEDWRNNGWRWECFGRMVPVKNADLWQRIDRALQFHRLECRTWRFDIPAASERVEVAPAIEKLVEQPVGKPRHRRPDRHPANNRPAVCGDINMSPHRGEIGDSFGRAGSFRVKMTREPL